MRLDELILTAFGRFHGRSIPLSAGLNVIYGPNEAGKSTIGRFILGMLYGFKKQGQRRDFTADLARYKPWRGDDYRGALLYTLDRTDYAYRVERQFDQRRDEVRLFDAATGSEVTGQFSTDRRKELLFAEGHWGLSEEAFRTTAWVGQMQVGQFSAGRELMQRVANLQESGREDLSVRGALAWLDERIRQIGSERAPTRPYGRVLRLIQEKQAELEQALRTREQTRQWEARLTEVTGALAELEADAAELRRRLQWAMLSETDARLARMLTGADRALQLRREAEALAAYADFPFEHRDRIGRAQNDAAFAAEQIVALEERLRVVGEQESLLRTQLEHFQGVATVGADAFASIGTTEMRADIALQMAGLVEEAERLQGMVAQLDETIESLRPAGEEGTAILTRVEELEEEIARHAAQVDEGHVESLRSAAYVLERRFKSAGGPLWRIVGGGALLLGGACYAARFVGLSEGLSFGAALVLGAAGIVGLAADAVFVWRRGGLRREWERVQSEWEAVRSTTAEAEEVLRRCRRERDGSLAQAGALSTSELRGRIVRYEQLTARRDGEQMRQSSVDGEIRRLEMESTRRQAQRKMMMAQALGVALVEGMEEAEQSARLQSAYEAYQADLNRVDGVERERRQLEDRIAEERRRMAHAQEMMTEVLGMSGTATVAAYAESCARREAYERALHQADSVEAALHAQLEPGTDEAVLRAEVERLRSRVAGEAPQQLEPSAVLREALTPLEARRSELGAQASDLTARVETALHDRADTADLRRELQALQEERAEYDQELTALALARETLESVSQEMHREFAPKLNRTMGETVATLTGGRYQSVRVDEQMAIRAITDDHRTVDLADLSGGTIDQFYLALRLTLLDLLTDGQEQVPLILDDPFVQYDDERALMGMETLSAISLDRQVILMTCHQREVRLAQALGGPVRVTTLAEGAR